MSSKSQIRGDVARAHRKAAHLTIKQLGELAGVASPTIHHIESGDQGTTVDTAILLADALGLSLDEYLGHEKREPVV